MSTYLVVANKTAESTALRSALQEMTIEDPQVQFVLLVPATPSEQTGELGRDMFPETAARASRAHSALRAEALPVVEARAADGLPLRAIATEIAAGRPYDGIIISTLPPRSSAWIAQSLPQHVERRWRLPVRHVFGTEVAASETAS